MPVHSASVSLPCSVAGLRAFLGHTANLPRISDPELELNIVRAPADVAEGEEIEFLISALGFKQRATNRYITVNDSEIIEEQIDGPLRAWRHHQRIVANSDGGVTLTDEFTFEPPGGMMGFVMTAARICESIDEGLRCRYETLQELVAQGEIA